MIEILHSCLTSSLFYQVIIIKETVKTADEECLLTNKWTFPVGYREAFLA